MTPVIVVPCFNEERRLQLPEFEALTPRARLLFVDDGSTDGTAALVSGWAARGEGRELLKLPRNVGKAEAVRAGLRHAVAAGAEVVGYLDADLATPVPEVHGLLDVFDAQRPEVLLAARVRLLGRDIDRVTVRHWLGRVFATVASLMLRIPVYDTQCGAKLFGVTPALRAALDEPFRARWAFDVELLGRLLVPPPGTAPAPLSAFVEVPLRRWRDVGGSKLTRRAMLVAGLDLLRIGTSLAARRRARGPG